MNVNLIPFRTYHFAVPASLVLSVLHLIITNDVRFFIENIGDDLQFLSLTVSVNLTKSYQRKAAAEIESLITDVAQK